MEWEGISILRKILWKRGKLDSFESNVMKIKENLRRESTKRRSVISRKDAIEIGRILKSISV